MQLARPNLIVHSATTAEAQSSGLAQQFNRERRQNPVPAIWLAPAFHHRGYASFTPRIGLPTARIAALTLDPPVLHCGLLHKCKIEHSTNECKYPPANGAKTTVFFEISTSAYPFYMQISG
jgi:hypothetical protein